MITTCGQCGRSLDVPDHQNVVICLCKAAISRPGTPLSEIVVAMKAAGVMPAIDYGEQMREWAARNNVTPLYPQTKPNFPLQPDQVARDASAAFGRESENATRAEFYASWSAYDAALQGMPPRQQDLQRRAEVLELERMAAL